MKKAVVFIIIGAIFYLGLVVFQITYKSKPVKNYCLKIDTLVLSYKRGDDTLGGIHELEKASGIKASCRTDTIGCIYDEASFMEDIKRWKDYFKCR